MSQAAKLYSAGFSETEVQEHVKSEAAKLLSGGFSPEEVDKYTMETYGMKLGQDSNEDEATLPMREMQTEKQHEASVKRSMQAEVDLTSELAKTESKSWSEAMALGFNSSNLGLALDMYDPQETLGDDPSILSEVAYYTGQGLGDLPSTVAGGIMGFAGGGPVGAMGGAIATTEALRASLMGQYKYGKIDTFEKAVKHTGDVLTAAGTGALMGTAIGKAGQVTKQSAKYITAGPLTRAAQVAAQPAVEVMAATAMGSAMQMKMPALRDFLVAGIQVGGERLGGFYTNKLAYEFQKSGKSPKSIIAYANKNLDAKEDLLAPNMVNPKQEGGAYTPVYRIKGTSATLPWYRQSLPMAERIANSLDVKAKLDYAKEQVAFEKAQKAAAKKKKPKEGEEAAEPLKEPVEQKYGVEKFAVPADAQWLSIYSNSDPNINRLYKQFKLSENPEHKFGTVGETSREARKALLSLDPAFINFIKSGNAMLGENADIPVKDIVGIRLKDRSYVIDESQLLSGEMFDKMSDDSMLAADAIQSSISVGESSKKSIVQTAKNTYAHVIDRFQALNKEAKFGEVTVPYMMARLLQGTDGLVSQWLNYGTTAFASVSTKGDVGHTRENIGPSLKQILGKASKPDLSFSDADSSAAVALSARIKDISFKNTEAQLKDLDAIRDELGLDAKLYEEAKLQIRAQDAEKGNVKDPLNLFRTYIVAKRAKEMHSRGEETGIPYEDAVAIADNPAYQKAFENATQELYTFQRSLLDYRLQSGLISKKAYDKILAENQSYIPMHRVMDDGDPRVQSTGTYAIKGSDRDIIDPIESIIRQTQYTLHDAERNQVMRLIADQYGKKTVSRGEAKGIATAKEMQDFYAKQEGSGAQKTIKYRVAGSIRTAEVPYDVYNAAQYLDPTTAQMSNALLKGAAWFASMKRAGTVLDPEFLVRNSLRDQFSAAINSDSGYVAFFDMAKGLGAVLSRKSGGKLFPGLQHAVNDWQKHGGANANLVTQDRKYSQEIMDTLLKTNNVHNSMPLNAKAVEGIKAALNPKFWYDGTLKVLRTASELSEDATRIGEYMRAREQGSSPFESAFKGREITQDFARMGASMKGLNAMSVFLNARVQGADRIFRQAMSRPTQTLNRITAGVIVPSLLFAMVREDYVHNNPESEISQALLEVPQWQKDLYWIVPTPIGLFRLPKPHEYGIPFANPVESFVEHLYRTSEDKSFLSKLMDDGYFATTADQFLIGRNFFSIGIPTATAPVLDVMTNYNMFTAQPIVTASHERLLPEARFNRNTTETSKAISQVLGEIAPNINNNLIQQIASPVSIDYLVKAYTGTLGNRLWQAIDVAGQKAGILPERHRPTKKLEDMPIIKAFMVKYPNAGSESVNKFYEQSTHMEQRLATIKHLAKQPDASARDRAKALMLEGNYGSMTNIRRAITALSRNITAIDFNKDIPPEDKARQIDTMYLHMIQIAREGNKIMQQLKSQLNQE